MKPLGNTEISLAPIGMGTGFTDGELQHSQNIIDVLSSGLDHGMNLIDTAESYGKGLCEELIGKAVKGRRERVVIASKFSPEHSSYNDVITSCEGSLRRLGTDYIDLYQMHWPNPRVPMEETFRALAYLKERGSIRAIGMSNLSREELHAARAIAIASPIVSLQTEYNLFERTVEQHGVLAYCNRHAISLIAYSPMDQGRIASLGGTQSALLAALAKKYEKTIVQLLLNWLIFRDPVIVIPKTTNLHHLAHNAVALDFTLTPDDVARIDEAFYEEIVTVPVEKIFVSPHGERDRNAYQTLRDAIENKLNHTPSPMELAETFKKGGFLRPVRLIPAQDGNGHDYELINGRIRYWAWVIAFEGKRPIPAYIRYDLEKIDKSRVI